VPLEPRSVRREDLPEREPSGLMFIIKITVRPLVELATARTGHHIGADETAFKLFKRELLHVAYFESGQVFDRCGDRRERGRHGPSGYSTRRQQSRHDTDILALPDQSSDERSSAGTEAEQG
jgi:hypothetical protein